MFDLFKAAPFTDPELGELRSGSARAGDTGAHVERGADAGRGCVPGTAEIGSASGRQRQTAAAGRSRQRRFVIATGFSSP